MKIIVREVLTEEDQDTIIIEAGRHIIRSGVWVSKGDIFAVNFDNQQVNWLNVPTGIVRDLVSKYFAYKNGQGVPPPWDLGDFEDIIVEEALEGNFSRTFQELERRWSNR